VCKIKLSPETETPVTQHTPENPVFEAPFMADDSDVMTTKFFLYEDIFSCFLHKLKFAVLFSNSLLLCLTL
jgi:hypothetical protein